MNSGRKLCFMMALALAGAVMSCAVSATGADDTKMLLERADATKSTNSDEFKVLLEKLHANKAALTLSQREHLQYLDAYSSAFDGRYDVATGQAQKLFESTKDGETRFRALALLVNVHGVERRFTEALRELETLLSLVDGVGDAKIRHQGLGAATTVYNQVGQYKAAMVYAERIIAEGSDPRSECFAYQAKLEASEKLHLLPTTDEEITRTVGFCAGIGELAAANTVRMTLARKWNSESKSGEAIAFLNRYMAEIEGTHYPYLISEAHAFLAELLLQQGSIAEAEQHASISVLQGQQVDFSLPVVHAYKTLFDISMRKGDVVNALARFQKYAEADKAYLTEVQARETAYQIVRQETLQKSQQIALLDKSNQVLVLRQKVSKQQQNLARLGVLFLLVVVGLIGLWAYRVKRSHVSLRRLAQVDALTGISNRHHFSQLSEALLVQSARSGEEVALLMFDLDHFKSINDRFGHDTGDWVLKKVAETCKGFCRRVDYLGRLGGEEFAILLVGCDERGAVRVAEDCRMRLATIDTSASHHKFLVTASFGVTSSARSGYELPKLLSHADQALYRAKRAGRNRVCSYDGEPPQWSQSQVTGVDSVQPLPAARPASLPVAAAPIGPRADFSPQDDMGSPPQAG